LSRVFFVRGRNWGGADTLSAAFDLILAAASLTAGREFGVVLDHFALLLEIFEGDLHFAVQEHVAVDLDGLLVGRACRALLDLSV